MFENYTKLNHDIALNDFGLTADVGEQKYLDYYFIVCDIVAQVHWARPAPNQIEQYLKDGYFFAGTEKVSCPILLSEERKYLLLSAQAKQLQYDMLGGRGALLRGEDKRFNVCEDTLSRLKMLGLYWRRYLTR